MMATWSEFGEMAPEGFKIYLNLKISQLYYNVNAARACRPSKERGPQDLYHEKVPFFAFRR